MRISSIRFSYKPPAQIPNSKIENTLHSHHTEVVIPNRPPAKKNPDVSSPKMRGIKNTITNVAMETANKNALKEKSELQKVYNEKKNLEKRKFD